MQNIRFADVLPFQTFRLKVAGFPGPFLTALNKSCLYYFYVAKRKCVPLLTMFVNFLIFSMHKIKSQ